MKRLLIAILLTAPVSGLLAYYGDWWWLANLPAAAVFGWWAAEKESA